MHLQVLSSGSGGNATLVRAGETHLLIDAGLPLRELMARCEAANVAPSRLDHIAVTHGHLDHSRSAGRLSRKCDATLHCCERLMRNRSMERAKRMNTLRVGTRLELEGPGRPDGLFLTPVKIPHDADPTVAFRIEHELADGVRTAVVLTDMGRPDPAAQAALTGAHLLVLEFNHDHALLNSGPYPPVLRRRVGGNGGHLNNGQAAEVLRALAGPELHTLVLAHLSEKNNTPELALAAARGALAELGLDGVQVLCAEQHAIGPNLAV